MFYQIILTVVQLFLQIILIKSFCSLHSKGEGEMQFRLSDLLKEIAFSFFVCSLNIHKDIIMDRMTFERNSSLG